MGRPGLMRGRPAGREGDLREPMMVDPRFARPVDEQGEQDGGRRLRGGPAPRPSARLDLREGQVHGQDQVTHGRDQTGREAGRAAGTGAAGSSRRWTREGQGLSLDWIWNDEHKVWVPERPQRDEEELIGELDLDVEMERNYGKACRKLLGMERQREYLFGAIKELRGKVRRGQEEAQFWKEQCEKVEKEKMEEGERFVTPVAEVFETPMTQVVAPLPPPPPPPPRPVARPTSRTTSTPRARTRSPTRDQRHTPGGTRVPEGGPPQEVTTVVEPERWGAGWEDQQQGSSGWWYQNWSGMWNYWDGEDRNPKAETKPPDQIETGGAGAKVELPELAYDHSPLTLGDWFALVGPQMQDLSQGAAEWWKSTMEEAKKLYEVWLRSTPLDRLKITVGIPEALRTARFVRTEQRGVTLLLRAIPEEIRKELISARDISSTGVLYRLLVTYQPGGPGERSLILRKLTDLGQMRTFGEAVVALREWRRYYLRAHEIGASRPYAPGCCIGEGDAAGESWRAASISGCPGADTVGARHHAHGAEHLELLRVAACGDGHGKVDDSGNGQGEGDGHGYRSGKACSGLCEKGDEYGGVQVLWVGAWLSLGKRGQMESRLGVSRGSECAVLDLRVEAVSETGLPGERWRKGPASEAGGQSRSSRAERRLGGRWCSW